MVSKEKPASDALGELGPRISDGAPALRMTYDEWRAWANETQKSEWVNGEVIIYMPPKPPHQLVIEFLSTLLNTFAHFFDLGRVIRGPVEMRAVPNGPAREPDILFIARDHADRVTEERVVGPADLVVEIISPDSVHRDRVDKFEEYEAAGIREYWILDNRPRRRRAEFYQLDQQGQYQPILPDEKGLYRSAVLPGFWLKVDWLWEDEFPDPQLTFAEIAGFSPETVNALEKLRASPPTGVR